MSNLCILYSHAYIYPDSFILISETKILNVSMLYLYIFASPPPTWLNRNPFNYCHTTNRKPAWIYWAFFHCAFGLSILSRQYKRWLAPKKAETLRICVYWFFKCEGYQARNHLSLIKQFLFSEKKALSPLLQSYNHRHYY